MLNDNLKKRLLQPEDINSEVEKDEKISKHLKVTDARIETNCIRENDRNSPDSEHCSNEDIKNEKLTGEVCSGEGSIREEQPESDNVALSTSNNASSKHPVIQWPWIQLKDNQNRVYYYNALTSKTSWNIVDEETSESKPPTAFTVATAQQAWQQYWQELKNAKSAANSVTEGDEIESTQKDGSELNKKSAQAWSVYVEHYQSPNAKQLGRPARQQVKPPEQESLGYTQGYEEYNIWYGKHLTNRSENTGTFGRQEMREKATTRCNPFTDVGWTRCDLESQLDRPVICIFFARGCCYLGSKCWYYHRLPTAEDDERLDMLHDIFGRERFASHKEDMDGVGTFSEDCRTLYVGDLKVNRVYTNVEEKTEELIRQQFGLWGPIENIKVISNKNIAFVRYKYRVHAEFAKVAMAEQRLLLDRTDDQISVRWAHPGRGNEDKPEEQDAAEWNMANKAIMKRLTSLGYTQDDLNCLIRWELQNLEKQQGFSNEAYSVYPDTSAKYNLESQNGSFVELGAIPTEEEELKELQKPDSEAFQKMQKMQSVLSKIEDRANKNIFSMKSLT